MSKRPKPIVLTVLDGWGYRAERKGNAVALAKKPAYDELIRRFPNTLIHTSGPFVGLPEGQMGNSEVGHMNMGAGRIVHMDITRIDLLIANKQLQNVPLFQQAMERGRTRQLHLVGLLSDGGVQPHMQTLFVRLVCGTGVARRRSAVGITCASCSRKCGNWLSARSLRWWGATMRWTATTA